MGLISRAFRVLGRLDFDEEKKKGFKSIVEKSWWERQVLGMDGLDPLCTRKLDEFPTLLVVYGHGSFLVPIDDFSTAGEVSTMRKNHFF